MIAPISPLLGSLLRPWEGFLDDLTLVEIMAVKPGEFVLETHKGEFLHHLDTRLTLSYWEGLIHTLANEQGLEFKPEGQGLLAAILPDARRGGWHRFEAMWGDRVQNGISVSVRLRRVQSRTMEDFGLEQSSILSLKKALKKGSSMLISGGTSSGKTSLLNILVKEIPLDKRIITIEDTPELDLPHPHWVSYRVPRYASSRHLSYQSLIDHVVRMRPDILITGEISVDNCFPILRLLNTGHKGFMSTLFMPILPKQR